MAKDNERDKIFSIKKSRLYVALQDGTLIQGKNGIETFLMFIEEKGCEKVRDLNFLAKGENLILDHQPDNKYREVAPGWYAFTGHRGVARKVLIHNIANALQHPVHVGWDKE
mgnify:CR=1 FL=1